MSKSKIKSKELRSSLKFRVSKSKIKIDKGITHGMKLTSGGKLFATPKDSAFPVDEPYSLKKKKRYSYHP